MVDRVVLVLSERVSGSTLMSSALLVSLCSWGCLVLLSLVLSDVF